MIDLMKMNIRRKVKLLTWPGVPLVSEVKTSDARLPGVPSGHLNSMFVVRMPCA